MTRHEIEAFLDRYEPRVRSAFLDAIADITDQVVLRRFTEALERRDIEGAMLVIGVDPAAFGPLQLAVADAYYGAGLGEAVGIRARDPDGNRVVFRFGVRNPETEEWLRSSSSQLVTRITEDAGIALRSAMAAGLARGDNPNTTALDVVGRINRATGRREGGIVGLTAAQEGYVSRARDNLLSGDPDLMRAYLDLTRRDKRFDRTVLRAINEGRALSREEVSRIVGRLADSYLQLRGETIARHETMQALAKGRDDAIHQAVREGKVDAGTTTKIWRNAGDGRVRRTHQHGSLGGQKVGFDQPFISASGAQLRYPHDPAAPTSETLGCRCWVEYKMDFFARVVQRYRESRR